MASGGSARWRVPVVGIALLVLLAAAAWLVVGRGGAGAAVEGAPSRLVTIDFDSLADGSPPRNTGPLDTTVKVSTTGGGAITAGPDPDGAASGDYPAWDGASPYQRAAVTVLSNEAGDPLSPGTRDFEFGAALTLDTKSAGSRLDNGDNLMQRGLYGDKAQYKIQVDSGHVSCRVKGSGGASMVRSSIAVTRNAWYSTSCARDDGRLVLKVTRPDGSVETRSVAYKAGAVTMKSPGVRLSIGAKVGASGAVIAGAADQFNGLIDDAYVSIAPAEK
jgi:hypothetical protein